MATQPLGCTRAMLDPASWDMYFRSSGDTCNNHFHQAVAISNKACTKFTAGIMLGIEGMLEQRYLASNSASCKSE